MAGRLLTYPERGAFRVHRAPTTLIRRSSPRHRFDDPENEYGVWYFATTLRGAMIEVLDHWRTNPSTEATLAGVQGVEELDILDPAGGDLAGSVPLGFLTDLRLTKGRLTSTTRARVLNVVDEDYLAFANLAARVRAVLDAGGPGVFGSPPTLNFGTLQSAHPAARLLTQALSRTIYEEDRGPAGIRYISRHTENEECWAIFDDASRREDLSLREPELLDPTLQHHRRAVGEAAALLRLQLPDVWA